MILMWFVILSVTLLFMVYLWITETIDKLRK
jgi:hypothetical protein